MAKLECGKNLSKIRYKKFNIDGKTRKIILNSWGCVCSVSVNKLVFINGILNCQLYLKFTVEGMIYT